jgi:ABC-type multidrug transport system fused ATPase/permease subunit
MKNFLSLLNYIKPYWKEWVLNILFNLLSVVFSISTLLMLSPFLGILFGTQPLVERPGGFLMLNLTNNLNYIFSELIRNYGKYHTLLIVSALIVTFSMLRNLFSYLSMHFLSPMRAGIVKDIRYALFNKVLGLPLSYFSNERKGDLMARMTNDVGEIEASIISSLEMVFRDPLTIIIYLIFLFSISAHLTLFVLIMLPISGLIIGRIGRSLKKKSFKSQTKLGTLLALIEETLSGLRIVKAFNAEGAMRERFKVINNDFTKILVKINRRRALASPMGEFLGTVVMIVIMIYGASLILNHKSSLQPQEFITFLATFYMIIEPAKRFSTAYYNIQKGMASAERIDFILKAENKIKEKKDAIEKNNFIESIEYCNVSFKYDQYNVLENIDLKIEKGKTIALVGQSGSGKSTLVDLLPRFYDIEHGEILIDGINIKDYKIKNLRSLMGIVNQEAILFNDTFYNNILFGRDSLTREEVEAAAKVAHAYEFISTTKHQFEHNIGDRGGKLSGGQRQRVSIARAVLNNPPILILDEATSALDTESERLVQDALTNLMQNRTTIVIAHRLSTVIHADEICVLHEGKIVERGKHEYLLSLNGYYKKLHDLQMFAA